MILGVDTSHAALSGRFDMNGAYDFVENDSIPNDEHRHGTHVSGIIIKNTPSNVKIVPIKVLDDEGNGIASRTVKGIARAINVSDADIINLSLGSEEDIIVPEEENVLKEAYNKEKIVIAASGNGHDEGMDFVSYPASSKYTIGVGAIDNSYNITYFSQRGPEIDYVGLGSDIYSTIPNNAFERISGTSMSTPYISAACALAKIQNPTYSRSQIYSYLNKYSIDLGTTGKDDIYGNGFVNFSTMFEKPEIIKYEIIKDTGVNNKSSAKVTFIAKNEIKFSKITTTSDIPTSWNEITASQCSKITYTGLEAGKVYYVWAKDGKGNIVNQKIEVASIPVTSVSLDKTNLTIEENEKETLKATINPPYATNLNVIWSSSDENIVKVDDSGNITAIKEGNADIIVKSVDGNKTATCNVQVNPISVKSVEINKENITLKEKQEEELTAIVKPDNAKNKEIEWSSANTEIATVDYKGLVKAVKIGETEIIATSVNGNKTAKCKVIVNEPPEKIPPSINVSYSESKNGEPIIVTLTSNEKIKPLEGWTLSEDRLVLTKEYTKSTNEFVQVQDISDNATTVRIVVTIKEPEKDTTPPQITIKYSDSKVGEPITVTIISNENIQAVEGWELIGNDKQLVKQYDKSVHEKIEIKDLAGNITVAEIDVTIKSSEKDTTPPRVTINYSDRNNQEESVLVTLTADEVVQEISGWNLSDDKKVLTKEYTETTIEDVKVKDLEGNTTTVTVNVIINDITDNPLTYNINYYKNLNRGSVTVEILANKEIKPIPGWRISEDKKSITKDYYVNKKSRIEIEDLEGNKITVQINVVNAGTKLSIDGGQISSNIKEPGNTTIPDNPNQGNTTVPEPEIPEDENIVSNKVENNSVNEPIENNTSIVNNSINQEQIYNFGYKIENNFILDVKCKTTIDNFKRKLNNVNNVIIKSNTKEITEGYVATGMIVEMNNSEYIIVVLGDVNGDGIANSKDSMLIKSYRNEVLKLENAYLKAADINKDGKVNIQDSKLLLYHRADVTRYSLNYK